MSKHWSSRLTAAWFLGLVAAGAASCAVAPPEPERLSALADAAQPSEEATLSASSRQGMGALARRVQAADGTALHTPRGVGMCNQADPNEHNDHAGDSTDVPYVSVSYNPPECWEGEMCDETSCWTEQYCEGYGSAWTGSVEGTICKNDEDWFLLPTESLPFDVSLVLLRAMAAGASYCPFTDYGEPHGYDPPASPDNTLQVEVYNATTLELVGSSSSSIGRVWMNLEDLDGVGNLNHDLYLRFRGPKEAKYSYHFSLSAYNGGSEDECEY